MTENDITRLENYDKMFEAVKIGLEDATSRMAQLRNHGKSKSATYKQLLTQKLTYKNILEMYKLFGIN